MAIGPRDAIVRERLGRIKGDRDYKTARGHSMPYPRPASYNWSRPDERILEDLDFLLAEVEKRLG